MLLRYAVRSRREVDGDVDVDNVGIVEDCVIFEE